MLTEENMSEPAKKDTQKSAKGAAATGKRDEGFTAEERAAMKERAKELKAAANKADEESDVLAKIDPVTYQAQLDQAKAYYDKFNYLDAFRLATAASS